MLGLIGSRGFLLLFSFLEFWALIHILVEPKDLTELGHLLVLLVC